MSVQDVGEWACGRATGEKFCWGHDQPSTPARLPFSKLYSHWGSLGPTD